MHDNSAVTAHVVSNNYFFPAVITSEIRATKLPVVVNAFNATLGDSSVGVEKKEACIQMICMQHCLSKYEFKCLKFISNVMKNYEQRRQIHPLCESPTK